LLPDNDLLQKAKGLLNICQWELKPELIDPTLLLIEPVSMMLHPPLLLVHLIQLLLHPCLLSS
jgi:hypothetical protein